MDLNVHVHIQATGHEWRRSSPHTKHFSVTSQSHPVARTGTVSTYPSHHAPLHQHTCPHPNTAYILILSTRCRCCRCTQIHLDWPDENSASSHHSFQEGRRESHINRDQFQGLGIGNTTQNFESTTVFQLRKVTDNTLPLNSSLEHSTSSTLTFFSPSPALSKVSLILGITGTKSSDLPAILHVHGAVLILDFLLWWWPELELLE